MTYTQKILLTALAIFFLTGCSQKTPQNHISQAEISGDLSKKPGKIANVFGWGYNRTSCLTDNGKDTIIFFYAEDQHLYFTFASNTSLYGLAHESVQNPDFDIFCDKNNDIYISHSDPNQQNLFLTKVTLDGHRLIVSPTEKVYSGTTPYSAVAPQLRIYHDTPYIVFMQYGNAQYDQDSKAYISNKTDTGWYTQQLFQNSAKNTTVLGVSLEIMNDSLMAFSAPNPEGFYSFVLTPANNRWSAAFRIAGIEPKGHLEWLTMHDSKGILHMIYRNEKQSVGYAQYDGTAWSTNSLDSLGINAFTMFKDSHENIYLLYNKGTLRKVIGKQVSKSVDVQTDLGANQELTFLRVPENVQDEVFAVWVKPQNDVHELFYGSFKLSDYENDPKLNEVDPDVTFFSNAKENQVLQ